MKMLKVPEMTMRDILDFHGATGKTLKDLESLVEAGDLDGDTATCMAALGWLATRRDSPKATFEQAMKTMTVADVLDGLAENSDTVPLASV